MPVATLVGYTNAGKSTLMRRLSGADVLAEDRLFATLDPVTRRVRMPSGVQILLTDTVGFIEKLPTQLVAAFRATLEELAEADLLVHIVDVSHANVVQHVESVEATLCDLGVGDRPRIVLLNKVDLLCHEDGRRVTGLEDARPLLRRLAAWPADALPLSAATGWGVKEVLLGIERSLSAAGSDRGEVAGA